MIIDIQRVVSVFILSRTCSNTNEASNVDGASSSSYTRENLRVAVFHRVETMPSFPNHFAPCSGSIEPGETPWETACREVREETNLENAIPDPMYGLYVDVPHPTRSQRVIRVYPFTLQLNADKSTLELKGTEHDYYRFVSIDELEQLKPAVPALAQAFHHATRGQFLQNVPETVISWANDKVNGAAALARNAARLLMEYEQSFGESCRNPADMKMMRPSMVAITNILQSIQESRLSPLQALESLKEEQHRVVAATVDTMLHILEQKVTRSQTNSFRIATFSRSSTLVSVLNALLDKEQKLPGDASIEILCGNSTPGDEGQLMTQQDLKSHGAICVEDDTLRTLLESNEEGKGIDLFLLGSDCVMTNQNSVVNKVGTKDMALSARASKGYCQTICCADRWKLWEDQFPPPLEDIFELVPQVLFDHLIVPGVSEVTN